MEPNFNCHQLFNGLLVPARWDNNGNITGITLACRDEKEYPILMDDVGKGLIAYLQEEVTIVGSTIKLDNVEGIRVNSFNKKTFATKAG